MTDTAPNPRLGRYTETSVAGETVLDRMAMQGEARQEVETLARKRCSTQLREAIVVPVARTGASPRPTPRSQLAAWSPAPDPMARPAVRAAELAQATAP